MSELLPRLAFKGDLVGLKSLLAWVERRAAVVSAVGTAPPISVREALEESDCRGRNALLSAVRGQQLKVAEQLLRLGADPNATLLDASCDSALHLASRRNHSALVECLVAAGADVGACNAQGLTPLEVSLHAGGTAERTGVAAGPRALRRVRKTLRAAVQLAAGGDGNGDTNRDSGDNDTGAPQEHLLNRAGEVLDLSDAEAMLLVQGRLDAAVSAAPGFALNAACELPDELRAVALAGDPDEASPPAPPPGARGWDWDHVTQWRIKLTYSTRHEGLVWLDDKLLQVREAARLLNAPLGDIDAAALKSPRVAPDVAHARRSVHHLPVLAHASREALLGFLAASGRSAFASVVRQPGTTEQQGAAMKPAEREGAAFVDALQRCVDANEPLVIKPRHGANGHAVGLFPTPRDDSSFDKLLGACLAALQVDNARLGENWQLARVPRGVVLQPLYCGFDRSIATGSEPVPARTAHRVRAPLELKVQTLFGVVIGATLHTHPWQFWVMGGRDECEGGGGGALHAWREVELEAALEDGRRDTSKRLHPPRKWRKLHGAELPPAAVSHLCTVLRRDWSLIAAMSSRLAIGAGLDELRVDWLVGDEHWGPRIGELTYIGGAERLVPNLSKPFARAFLAAHGQRLLFQSNSIASVESELMFT